MNGVKVGDRIRRRSGAATVLSVSKIRVQVLWSETGKREWLDRIDFATA